jgi:hypothetical protein
MISVAFLKLTRQVKVLREANQGISRGVDQRNMEEGIPVLYPDWLILVGLENVTIPGTLKPTPPLRSGWCIGRANFASNRVHPNCSETGQNTTEPISPV